MVGTAVYNPHLVRIRGNYDDVNRLCAQAADRFGWGLVNINLRGYYGEGSKTVAFEICEQLGWRLPTAVVAPMAGGSLVTKLGKGFAEFADGRAGVGAGAAALRRAGGRAARRSCGWWSRAASTIQPVIPNTIARSIAIGNPADGRFAAEAIRGTGGWVAGVTRRRHRRRDPAARRDDRHLHRDRRRRDRRRRARARARAAGSRPDDEVVLCITGNGLKTVEALQGALPEAPVIAPRLEELEALYGRDL